MFGRVMVWKLPGPQAVAVDQFAGVEADQCQVEPE